ncbi:MarR family winged helix-turn-helix transcriptional regulator [Alteraurantiacibacter aquimixticola]|uniref:MarR family transcriptional regulator n=1 Tax=Alteraurantiacibacter aquimixticola TaxID=2489173 RepID=A0A4T3F3U1_9SPHN|nr:MarR family winged helix-turn-helix transcriptional regulator [Alteraurantiacibacter aquimixticola]TIX51903.1 MarR family transcriptional regulator [Alteraurantiacibacter aquimixticola]
MSQVPPKSEGNAAGNSLPEQQQLNSLVSMRMVVLFNLMRRSTILTQRRLFDLSEIEWRIMTNLSEGMPLSLNGLAERLVQDRGQLSRTVKRMVERGLLTRTRKPGGPEIEIGLAKGGLELRAKMVERAVMRDEFLTAGIDPQDMAVLSKVVEHMIGRAEMLMEEALEGGTS